MISRGRSHRLLRPSGQRIIGFWNSCGRSTWGEGSAGTSPCSFFDLISGRSTAIHVGGEGSAGPQARGPQVRRSAARGPQLALARQDIRPARRDCAGLSPRHGAVHSLRSELVGCSSKACNGRRRDRGETAAAFPRAEASMACPTTNAPGMRQREENSGSSLS